MPTISGYASGEPIEAVDINQYFLRGNRNAIINGDMRVSQRFGTVATNVADGAYGLDRWVALGSGVGGVGSSGQNVLTLQTSGGSAGGNAMIMGGVTAGLKFGCVQIIENRNLAGIRSGSVTVSMKMSCQADITDVRCAVLGWSGTADAVTRDIISTSGTPWLSSPPTLAASWSYLNTPVNLNVTSGSMNTYRVNANVTGDPNNLAVFIWCNSTTHASLSAIQVTDVQLESGAIATPFDRKTFQEQLADCQRYYNRVTAVGANGVLAKLTPLGYQTSTTGSTIIILPSVQMRSSFTVSSGGTPQATDDITWSSDNPTLAISHSNGTTGTLTVVHASSGAQFRPMMIRAAINTTAFLDYSAEL